MITCICRNVSENRIIRAIEAGYTFEELQMDLGVCVRCGCCRMAIESLIKEYTPTIEEKHE
jgi:bacterioferritin-associated ferredoxin